MSVIRGVDGCKAVRVYNRCKSPLQIWLDAEKARREGVDLDHSRRDQSSNGVLAPAAVPLPSAVAEHLAALGGDHHGVLELDEA